MPNQCLLLKLQPLGTAGGLLKWLSPFLPHRQIMVKTNDTFYPPHDITRGVIQGSVLRPTLLLTYVNEIFGVVESGRTFVFADDIKITYTFKIENPAHALNDIQRGLNSPYEWNKTR